MVGDRLVWSKISDFRGHIKKTKGRDDASDAQKSKTDRLSDDIRIGFSETTGSKEPRSLKYPEMDGYSTQRL